MEAYIEAQRAQSLQAPLLPMPGRVLQLNHSSTSHFVTREAFKVLCVVGKPLSEVQLRPEQTQLRECVGPLPGTQTH